ncbi:GlpE protein [Neisseria subflava]|nr:GlpE protein [Neisseria subflava]
MSSQQPFPISYFSDGLYRYGSFNHSYRFSQILCLQVLIPIKPDKSTKNSLLHGFFN